MAALPPPTPTAAQALIQVAINDADVADLLTFVGRGDNWFDLYKAIEMAEKIAGGEHALRGLLGTGATAFKNARTTANWYRHARAYRPATPTTLLEARALVNHATREVLATKV